MSADAALLDSLELDAMTELVNIGVSHAAASLREMVGEQVLLSVPKLLVVNRAEAVALLQERHPSRLVAVHQQFEGDISGRVLLIFPDTKSLELVRAVAGGALTLEEIIELEHEALAETGNIILNNCMATMANLLDRNLKMSLPEIMRGDGPEFFALSPTRCDDVVMFLYIDFLIRQRDINGFLVILMDLPALVALRSLLDEFITRETGIDRGLPDARPDGLH